MRRLETEFDRESRQKRNKLILGIILIIVMFGSTLGYAFSLFGENSGSGETPQNLNELHYNGQSWIVERDGRILSFRSGLDEVKDIQIPAVSLSDYQNQPLYIASDNDLVMQEIASVMQGYASRVQRACYLSCNDSELPEKDCSSNLIVWKASEANAVTKDGKCIFIEGDAGAADAFLYRLLGMS